MRKFIVIAAIVVLAFTTCGKDDPIDPNDGNEDNETQYTVTIAALSNGTITADPTSGIEGTEITLTVTPEAAYQLKPNTLKHGTTPIDETSKKFNLPAENVTVSAEFELIPLCECDPKAHLGIDEDCACGGSGCDCTLQEPVTLSNGVTKVYAVGVDKAQLDTAVATLNGILGDAGGLNDAKKEAFTNNVKTVNIKPSGTPISHSNNTLIIAYNSELSAIIPYLNTNDLLTQLPPPHALRLAWLKIGDAPVSDAMI